MKDWGKRFDDKWNTLDKNGGFIHMITLNTHNPEAIKHFLATALEERRMKIEVETGLKNFQVTMEEIEKARADERQAVIKEIEGWLVARQLKNEREDEWTRGAYDELRELRAKLVEMKEEK